MALLLLSLSLALSLAFSHWLFLFHVLFVCLAAWLTHYLQGALSLTVLTVIET